MVAHLLRLPVLIGYLIAGIVVGPHTPGFIADESVVGMTAELGIVMLMFAVGVQFSLDELRHVRRTALTVGGTLFAGSLLLGILLALAFRWGVYGGVFLGCALFMSSTAVMLKVLDEKGELGTRHGAIILGVLVVQDLTFVLMVVLLPALAGLGTNGMASLGTVGVELLKAVGFVGGVLVLAMRVVPFLLERVARNASRELFLLTTICLCLLTAYVAEMMGLGLALGAFMAGLVISESPYAHEVFAQIRPLRDVFSSLFFVSVGMLLEPQFLVSHGVLIGSVTIAILLGKPLITYWGMHLRGYPLRVSLLVSLGLAQIGEFSFILAQIGASRNLVSEEVSRVILSSALLTLLCAPFLFQSAAPLYRILSRNPLLRKRRVSEAEGGSEDEEEVPHTTERLLQNHVLILGYGRVGRYVSDALRKQEIPHLVVDYDANALLRLENTGVRTLYGDVTAEPVLLQTRPQRARLAVVALPEVMTTQMSVEALRKIAPNLPIVVRVHRGDDIPRLRKAGADAVVHAEFEAGTEMIRQGLARLEVPDTEIEHYIEAVRQHRYRYEEKHETV
jgi:CPA2 family monovalent cation:H+ antiporter-2